VHRVTRLSSRNESPTWRAATGADLDAISEIADGIHVELPERPEVFAERLHLFPQGVFVLAQGSTTVGYGLSYPWLLHRIPPLDTLVEALPALPECLFLHDVAVLPHARGNGATNKLVEILTSTARRHQISSLGLVSVYGTHAMWARHGFEVHPDPRLTEKLKPYGATAKYMKATVRDGSGLH
jgi:GNAT superfamily N-acetyltransferase